MPHVASDSNKTYNQQPLRSSSCEGFCKLKNARMMHLPVSSYGREGQERKRTKERERERGTDASCARRTDFTPSSSYSDYKPRHVYLMRSTRGLRPRARLLTAAPRSRHYLFTVGAITSGYSIKVGTPSSRRRHRDVTRSCMSSDVYRSLHKVGEGRIIGSMDSYKSVTRCYRSRDSRDRFFTSSSRVRSLAREIHARRRSRIDAV